MPTPIFPPDALPPVGYTEGKGLFSGEALISEIRRREQLLLAFLGELCVVYISKTQGTPCGCFRDWQSASVDVDCVRCFGTGFLGGYDQLTIDRFQTLMDYSGLDPYGKDTLVTPNYRYLDQLTEPEIQSGKFLFRFPPIDNGITNDRLRLFDSAEARCWSTLTLPLKPRDIVVRASGERYRVKSVRFAKSLRGIFTHQKLQVQQVDEQDSVYRIGTTPINYQSDPEFENVVEPATIRGDGGLFLIEEYYCLFDFDNASLTGGCF